MRRDGDSYVEYRLLAVMLQQAVEELSLKGEGQQIGKEK